MNLEKYTVRQAKSKTEPRNQSFPVQRLAMPVCGVQFFSGKARESARKFAAGCIIGEDQFLSSATGGGCATSSVCCRFLFCLFFPGPAAICTDTDYAQQMLSHFKLVLGGHLILNCFEFGRIELYDLSTLGADHMVVMLVFVIVFVVRAAVAKTDLARQTGVRQQLQSAIDSRMTDRWIFGLDQTIEVFAGEVLFGAQEHLENQIPLGCSLQSPLLDVFEKYFLLFSHISRWARNW